MVFGDGIDRLPFRLRPAAIVVAPFLPRDPSLYGSTGVRLLASMQADAMVDISGAGGDITGAAASRQVVTHRNSPRHGQTHVT